MGNIYILSNKDIQGANKLPVIKQIFFKKDLDFKKYDYLIFTSKNGVLAAEKISKEWREIPSLAIGEATAKMIEKYGGKVVFIAKKFYGDEFAKEISQNFDKNSKFLYLRAKRVLSKLAAILENRGFYVTESIVYETICEDCKKLKRPPKNSFIIFSSPSTIDCFFRCFGWDDSYKAVAIGKKTATYIPSNIDYIISPSQSLQATVDFIKETLNANH
ncbi:uroporphyrinogen-III synthase [Nitrosophilus labii]|uniref:uroporphyrinogen-III synthase n=1 Tax=Nitrosophilus labii TaxID=2706014 RepID=UPI0016572EFA|nr:uroporphyrinogen-III synthase [Nitrosophilus labii]